MKSPGRDMTFNDPWSHAFEVMYAKIRCLLSLQTWRHGNPLMCDLTFRLIIYGSLQGVPDRQACGIDRFTYMLIYCPAFEVSDSGSYSCWGLFL